MPDYPAIAAEIIARMTEIDAQLVTAPATDDTDEDNRRVLALNDVLEKAFPNSDALEVAGYLLSALDRFDITARAQADDGAPPTLTRPQLVENFLHTHFDL